MTTVETKPHAAATIERTFLAARETCDLVMKGGITSGVIYPQAVLALARRYRFRNIGGTSAGAIAAAVTAAAEYGRQQGGFALLQTEVIPQLTSKTFIRDIFQPSDQTRPLLAGLLAYRRHQHARAKRAEESSTQEPCRSGSLWATVSDALRSLWEISVGAPAGQFRRSTWVGTLIGAIAAAVFVIGALLAGNLLATGLLILLAIVAIALGWLAGTISGIWRLLTWYLPREHFYGICTGKGNDAALTNWLAVMIDTLAGFPTAAGPDPADAVYHGIPTLRGKRVPLTFRHLALNHQPKVDPEETITLNMVTANVSQGQPYTMPFTSGPFLFSKEEFGELFPDYVVNYMIAISEAYPPLDVVREPIRIKVVLGQDRPVALSDAAPGKTHTLYFLPRGHDLPVVVATRMSLSFPVLIGAVPLWTLSEASLRKQEHGQKVKLEPGDLQRNWFSDGGTCSNFPIHFYDRWFPRKPTFGINLETLPDWLFEKGADQQPSNLRPEVQYYRSLIRPERQDGPHDTPQQWQVFEGVLKARPEEQNTLVQLPTPFPEDRPLPRWQPLCGELSSFAWSIINTGVFYRDTVQARLPSYYDRIVTVYHSENEGGLNVEMEQPVIDSIVARGAGAGEALRDRFRFERHRWVRLRLLLAEMEEQLIKLRGSVLPPPQRYATAHELCPDRPTSQARLDWNDPQVVAGLRLLLGAIDAAGLNENVVRHLIECEIQSLPAQSGTPADTPPMFPYPRDMNWAQQATERFLLLQLLMELWAQKDADGEEAQFFRDPGAPRRDGMSMRVAPEL